MEKIIEDRTQIIEVFENKIELCMYEYYNRFLSENDTDDKAIIEKLIYNSTDNQFTGCLMYICKHVFTDRRLLKDSNNKYSNLSEYNNNSTVYTNHNAYNLEIMDKLCDYYIYLCSLYNKTVSLYGYCMLTGINVTTIDRWKEPTCEMSQIYKKLRDGRQNSLTNLLSSGKVNPVGIIAILNHQYQWNESAAPDVGYRKKALPANELPTIELLSDNSQHNVQNETP